MKKIIYTLAALITTFPAFAQDYPLHSAIDRPRPLTATIVGVCEHRKAVLMVVVFTFDNGKTLIVDSKNMQGFDSADAILNYASTAEQIVDRVQICGDTSA